MGAKTAEVIENVEKMKNQGIFLLTCVVGNLYILKCKKVDWRAKTAIVFGLSVLFYMQNVVGLVIKMIP